MISFPLESIIIYITYKVEKNLFRQIDFHCHNKLIYNGNRNLAVPTTSFPPCKLFTPLSSLKNSSKRIRKKNPSRRKNIEKFLSIDNSAASTANRTAPERVTDYQVNRLLITVPSVIPANRVHRSCQSSLPLALYRVSVIFNRV